MSDYEVRDNWGRKIGTARPIGQSSGCGCWIVLGIALIVCIIYLCISSINLIVYHEFTPDSAGILQRATAKAVAS